MTELYLERELGVETGASAAEFVEDCQLLIELEVSGAPGGFGAGSSFHHG